MLCRLVWGLGRKCFIFILNSYVGLWYNISSIHSLSEKLWRCALLLDEGNKQYSSAGLTMADHAVEDNDGDIFFI